MTENENNERLAQRIKERTALVGVIGLGYVGLPLAIAFARAGLNVVGFDTDPSKVESINNGKSYLDHIEDGEIGKVSRRFTARRQFEDVPNCDAILIAVPTPLTANREPDLSFVLTTAQQISPRLVPGQLVVLESTSYPGTTAGPLREALERGGLKAGKHFFLAYSPEREDPGNTYYRSVDVPKLVGGFDRQSASVATALYQLVFDTVGVPDMETAEAAKLTENIFRAVNIALVNELKVVYDRMGIDIWNVIDAAATKPFGFMRFEPGPGVGGHCIPLDPFYLTWKAREYGVPTRFIELAGEINMAMPRYVLDKLQQGLNQRGKALSTSAVLLLGVAYKANVADMRESPTLPLAQLLLDAGATVDYHDPLVPIMPPMRRWQSVRVRLGESVALTSERLAVYDAIVVCTAHREVDYALVARHGKLVVDTRGVYRNQPADHVVTA